MTSHYKKIFNDLSAAFAAAGSKDFDLVEKMAPLNDHPIFEDQNKLAARSVEILQQTCPKVSLPTLAVAVLFNTYGMQKREKHNTLSKAAASLCNEYHDQCMNASIADLMSVSDELKLIIRATDIAKMEQAIDVSHQKPDQVNVSEMRDFADAVSEHHFLMDIGHISLGMERLHNDTYANLQKCVVREMKKGMQA